MFQRWYGYICRYYTIYTECFMSSLDYLCTCTECKLNNVFKEVYSVYLFYFIFVGGGVFNYFLMCKTTTQPLQASDPKLPDYTLSPARFHS